MHNIVLNHREKWFAYTINNKIIIEFFESERRQKILINSKDELSALCLSNDEFYLFSAVGFVNRDNDAGIYIYDCTSFDLIKQLNFHFKGIQCIKTTNDDKYLISIGSKEEKSICVWNLESFTVIDSSSVDFEIFDFVNDNSIKDNNIASFTTISQKVVSFWKVDENLKIEDDHISFEDITKEREENEWFSAIGIIPIDNQESSNVHILLGTTKGNILIMDKGRKILIKKFIICKFPITHLLYINSEFFCCGMSSLLLQWSVNVSDDNNNNNNNSVLHFLNKNSPQISFVDGYVTSIYISKYQKEGILTTNKGSLYIINSKDKSNLKLLSSHINCTIPLIISQLNQQGVISIGSDCTIRSWCKSSYDHNFKFELNAQIPNKCILNHKENILLVLFNYSFIRLFNLSNLSSFCIIKIPNCNITNFALLLKEKAIIIHTNESKIFILEVQNWEPPSILYTEAIPSPPCVPEGQNCKCLECKDISNEKTNVVGAYSDGTIITLEIDKVGGEIEVTTIDQINLIDNNISTNNLHKEITNGDYQCIAKMSYQQNGIYLCFHESVQFVYIRNFIKNEFIKNIPLNYFPYSISFNHIETDVIIGTKEGAILYMNKKGEQYSDIKIFWGHYDYVEHIKFTKSNIFLSSSHSEIIVWNFEK